MRKEVTVVIVGAGPSGLATSACLNLMGIPNVVLEKEDCHSSLWKMRAYDRLKLHLGKEFCYLPHMPHPPNAPTFIPRADFVKYLEDYVKYFGVQPALCRSVESAFHNEITGMWTVTAKNRNTGNMEEYDSTYLVVATGENSKPYIPELAGIESFAGEVLHSREYKSGSQYKGKDVLVVGCGNSGMEIAYDLCSNGAKTSIVVRSPFHVVTKEMIHLGMTLLNYLPLRMVDNLMLLLTKIKYGNLSKYGISKPAEGPFTTKALHGRSPVIDVGTVEKIKKGEIKVLPAISSVKESKVEFVDDKFQSFDAIVYATGYKSAAKHWLEDDENLLNDDGMPKKRFPNHWKGKNGLYCAGLSRRGLAGVSTDAQLIANDIQRSYFGY